MRWQIKLLLALSLGLFACLKPSPPPQEAHAPQLAALIPGPAAPRERMVFVQSWDGAPHHVIEEMLRLGRMPNLARLREAGVWAEKGAIGAFPCKTSAGHARLWTGAPERVNGIASHTVLRTPSAEHTILESDSGFSGATLRAEPFWITAARAGKTTLVWNAPQSYPNTATSDADPEISLKLEQNLRVVFDYADPIAQEGVEHLPADLGTGLRQLEFGPLQARLKKAGPDLQLDLLTGAAEAPGKLTLERNRPGAYPFALLEPLAPLQFKLFPEPDGSLLLFHGRAISTLGSGRELFAKMLSLGAGVMPNGPSDLYSSGQFGPTLMQGGTGLAEDRYLDVLGEMLRLNERALELSLEGRRWDLIVNYLPLPDEALHLWYGLVDKDFAPRNPELARKIRAKLELLLARLDRHLGFTLDHLQPRDAFFLVSDHGMDGADRDLVVNEALLEGGYLALDAEGKVDLSKTKAYYGPGYAPSGIVINTVEFQGGIVHPEEVPALTDELSRYLGNLKDPQDGKLLISGVSVPDGENQDWGGETGSNLYLDPSPGVDLKGGLGREMILRYPPAGRHNFYPKRQEVLAILFARAPELGHGAWKESVSQLHLAPTVCRLLGIEPGPSMRSSTLMELPREP